MGQEDLEGVPRRVRDMQCESQLLNICQAREHMASFQGCWFKSELSYCLASLSTLGDRHKKGVGLRWSRASQAQRTDSSNF